MLYVAAALKFKFDMDALPVAAGDFADDLAVREAGLQVLDDESEFSGERAEEKDDAGFVGGGMRHFRQQQRRTVDGAVGQNGAFAHARLETRTGGLAVASGF